jgi:glycosyltransferase involved in cell wall biosynthesis
VCTHNGEATIDGCLESLANQTLAPNRFSIVVVDDGSTDATADRVSAWQRAQPTRHCQLIRQAQAGLSAARNVGLANARAPIVAYIDDDAVASRQWLWGLLTAFEAFPAAAAVGGQVSVRWTSPKPRWWHDDLDEVFNRYRPTDVPASVDFPQLPYGCNVAVRRDVAAQLGGFRTDLGRHRGGLLAGEETELLLRVIEAGHEVVYWPEAQVEHLALARRVSRRHILRRAWMHGRSLARIAVAHRRVATTLPGVGGCLWRAICHAPRHRLRLAHWKYWTLRFGYHYEARRSGRGMVDPGATAGRHPQTTSTSDIPEHA